MNIFIEKNDKTGLLNLTSTLLFVCLLLTGIIFIHNSTIISIAFADSDKGDQNKQEHDDNQSDHSEKSNNDKKSGDNNELSSGISNEDPHKGNKPPKGDEPHKGDEPPIVVPPSPPPIVVPPSPVIITNTVTAPSVSSSSNDKDDENKEMKDLQNLHLLIPSSPIKLPKDQLLQRPLPFHQVHKTYLQFQDKK